LPHLQYDLATEIAEQRGGELERLTWIPEELDAGRVHGSQGQFVQSLIHGYDTSAQPVRVFYSYSHKDEDLIDELRAFLRPLERKGIISSWHDRSIKGGQQWDDEIRENLEEAQLILLLVSANFMASDYIYDKELAVALERHESSAARVVPIILRSVDWQDSSFAKLQALPKDGRPLSSWEDRDEALTSIVRDLRQIANEVNDGSLEAAPSDIDGDLLHCSFGRFKETVLGKFPTPRPKVDFAPTLYVTGGPNEFLRSPRAQEFCRFLRDQQYGVVEYSSEEDEENQTEHERCNMAYSDGLLIYAGDGPVNWVQAKALLANQCARRRDNPLVAAIVDNSGRDLGINIPQIAVVDGTAGKPNQVLQNFLDQIEHQYSYGVS
jgi:hypothetical protein